MAVENNNKKEAGSGGGQPGEASDQQSGPPGTGVVAVVGIGASAGGLEALDQLFRNMPSDTGLAFVVVTHQHPGHKSLLPELLSKITAMPVVAAADGLKVEANHVYVGPPGAQLSINGGKLKRRERDAKHAPTMPINYFLRSLAQDQFERSVCIILSGTGTDGTLGLQEIKAQAGLVIAEDPLSAKYAGMPASAIATGLVDFVLPALAIPEQLLKYVHSPFLATGHTSAVLTGDAEESLDEIFSLLRRQTGHDFSGYKSSTLRRRIARRMNLHQIHDYAQYGRYLQHKPDEIDILFKELLINVTNFFRDPASWEAIQPQLEVMVSSRPSGSSLRAWVPGCSSGEEVFSLAILLCEAMEAAGCELQVQIFGTDLDANAIEIARAGFYPESVADDLTPERLKRYFISEEDGYRIRPEIRDMTIFAPQNVIKDPPFTQMDIISCRNLMIYLNSNIQRKLLAVFHYALKPQGLLFLGSSETIGSLQDLFDVVDKRWKIFRARNGGAGRRLLPEFPLQMAAADVRTDTRAVVKQAARGVSIQRQIERMLLGRFVPASVIVSERGDIVYLHGRTGAYLEPSEGQPRNNLLEMAREGLQLELAEALRKAVKEGVEVTRNRVRVHSNGERVFVDVRVAKLEQPEVLRDLLLVSFEPSSMSDPEAGAQKKPAEAGAFNEEAVEQMERALKFMRETHQITLEDLETSNEELESANEELQSTNEELQSTNEELETSKEEMQSLNEELTTVNAELQSKVEELSQVSDDMQNLLNGTKIATIFLDEELNIKRFTEQATELVMLRRDDVGRPISELASKLEHEDLVADCLNVLKTLVFKEAEVHTSDGSDYLMRIIPYRTARNAIEGLVLTFVNITRLKQTQKDLRYLSEVFKEGVDPVFIVNLAHELVDLNGAASQVTGYTRDQMLGEPLWKIIPPAGRQQAEDLINRCRDGEIVRDVPWTLLNWSGDEVQVLTSLSILTGEDGEVNGITLIARSPAAEEAS